MESQSKSVYLRGAENGIVLGLYFCVMFIAMVAGEKFVLPRLLSSVMMLCVPFLIYLFLRKTYIEEKGYTIYAALWMQGIVSFAGAGIILAVLVYAYLKWGDPEFIPRQVALLIDVYGNNNAPESQKLVKILREMQHRNYYPSPRSIISQLIMLSIFTGSILSMIVALIVRTRKLSRKQIENKH